MLLPRLGPMLAYAIRREEFVMNDDLHDFEQFMKRREDAARAYVNGDAEPVSRIFHSKLSRDLFPSERRL